jgi:hypothetical protein
LQKNASIFVLNVNFGGVGEWLKSPLSKSGIRATVSEVQILPPPQSTERSKRCFAEVSKHLHAYVEDLKTFSHIFEDVLIQENGKGVLVEWRPLILTKTVFK